MDRDLVVEPVGPDAWSDVELLFGERGASSGCWCMWFRKTRAEWERDAGTGNKRELRGLVRAGDPAPGLLAYRDDEPVGWVALAPRDEYPLLQRSRNLGPVDDTPVWVISCFYIDRHHRGTGVATTLLAAAVRYAKANGARAVEGIPIDTTSRAKANADLYTGTLAMFLDAKFREVARRGTRPIVRRTFR